MTPTRSKRAPRAALIALMLASVPLVASAQTGFVLIVNQSNAVSSLTRAAVSKIFLRKRTTWPDGRIIVPVDQTESSPVRRHFSDAIHGMDVPSVKSFWQEMVFAGKSDPPLERVSDLDVVTFVKSNPDAFGYVGPTASLDGVKILALIP